MAKALASGSPAASMDPQHYEDPADEAAASWDGGPIVLAFLFAHPDSAAFRALDDRGGYFNVRTGDTWDLFFPGYFAPDPRWNLQRDPRFTPVGRTHARHWYFDAWAFDGLRQHIEASSQGRWEYSGGTDLVLIHGWMLAEGEPIIDWASTAAGVVTDESTATFTLSLPQVIERITRDLEQALEDPRYGVSAVTEPTVPERGESDVRKVMVGALGGVIAALGKHAAGI